MAKGAKVVKAKVEKAAKAGSMEEADDPEGGTEPAP